MPKVDIGDDVSVETQVGADVAVRVYTPKGRKPEAALLWIHGGGLIVGTPALDDERCIRFARELGILVVSPAYRLAPNHQFPAAHDDCYAAWRSTTRRAEALGIDISRIALGGGSAGGGLAATLAQRIHDEDGQKPAAQLLVYPMLDDRTAAGEDIERTRHLVWNWRSNRTGWSSYLGQRPGESKVPQYAVPARRNDLSGLPAAWIGVGSLDLFFDENRDYAKRLESAGVPCQFHAVEGAFHGFDSLMPESPVSKTFVEAQLKFLQQHLGHRSRRPQDQR